MGLTYLYQTQSTTWQYPAHTWRARCRAWAAIPSYKEGDIIRLRDPITLQDGTSVEVVERTHYTRRGRKMTCYKCTRTGALCRLGKPCMAGSVRIAGQEVDGSVALAEVSARKDRKRAP